MAGFAAKLSTLLEPAFFSALLSFYGKPIYADESTRLKDKMAASFDELNGDESMRRREIKLSQQLFLPC